MKALVTGAGGHLGSVVVEVLHGAGIEVLATDKQRRRELPVPIRIADLLNREGCYDLVDGVDVVVHLGAYPGAGKVDDQTTFNENVAMTMNVLQAAIESDCRKFVFSSSIQAACSSRRRRGEGDLPASKIAYLPMDGDLPALAGNTYALSKEAGEATLRYMARMYEASCVAIRFPYLISQKRLDWARREGRPDIYGWNTPPDEGFAYLSINDAARLIEAVLRSDLPGYRCYAPAARTPGVRQTVREIIQANFEGVELKKPIDQIESMFDITRIVQDTGWEPIDELG